MAESHGFIRILPDSTGKRIPHSVMVELDYGNGTVQINRGDRIVGALSGIEGIVLEKVGTITDGELHLSLRDPISGATSTKIQNNPQFIFGEPLQVNGITVANAASTGIPFYIQQSTLVGGTQNTNAIEVDRHGSLFTRYAEGSPTFDSFGKLQTSSQHIVAEYLNQYEIDTSKLFLNTVGSGSITHLPLSAGVLMSVGTDNGAKSEIVSNQYHPYRLGQSRLIEFTCAAGDAGKLNLDRIWGYGDDSDGCFFIQRDGIIYVLIRSSVSGVVTETLVAQSEWNKDKLDGSSGMFNPSGEQLDITTDTITWIDLQWLGAGTVRFGAVINGKRIICHEWHHSNTIANPYMRTATLPIYYEISNRGVTASSSEFRVWCTVVINEGDWSITTSPSSFVSPTVPVNNANSIPILSLRAKELFNGLTNRKSSYINNISIISTNSGMVLEIWKNATLTGATWLASDSNQFIDIDTSATTINTAGARKIYSEIIDNTGASHIDLTNVFNSLKEGIRRKFNPVNADVYTFVVRRLQNTNGDVTLAINWDDV